MGNINVWVDLLLVFVILATVWLVIQVDDE